MRRAAVLFTAALASCAGSGRGAVSTVLTDEIFEDLPAPATAAFEPAGSFSFQGSAYRCGRFFYSFNGSGEECAQFYRGTMTQPPYSWTLTEETSPGQHTLHMVFTKGEDRCTLDLDRLPTTVRIIARVNYVR